MDHRGIFHAARLMAEVVLCCPLCYTMTTCIEAHFSALLRSCHFKKRFDGRALSIANPGPPRSADRDENAPAIACGRSRAVAPRFGPAPIRAGRRHIRLNPGERQWRDERVN